MTVWTPVESLIDEPTPKADYWPTFKIGDRVRVRLSGECQMRYGRTRLTTGHVTSLPKEVPHADWEQGKVGTVRFLVDRDDIVDDATALAHTIAVEYDQWVPPDCMGKAYAAAELEHLP